MTARRPGPTFVGMQVEVRLFAACRERARTDRLTLEFEGDSVALRDFLLALSSRIPALEPLLPFTRIAVNQEFASADTSIRGGDEVALIPPVSGGSGLGPFAITTAPVDVAAVRRAVDDPQLGAVVTFEGTVRNRTGTHDVGGLDYESYEGMAEAFFHKIGAEIQTRWPGARVSIVHRIGHLEIGEVAVAIAVGTPHRADAFEACRHAIERIKEDVPIWKKELRRDGSVWVGLGS